MNEGASATAMSASNVSSSTQTNQGSAHEGSGGAMGGHTEELYKAHKAVKCAYPKTAGGEEYVLQCVCSDHGNRIAVSLSTKSVKIYEATTLEIKAHLKGHSGAVNDLTFVPGQETVLLTASSDGTVRIWDVDSAKCCGVVRVPRRYAVTNEDMDRLEAKPKDKQERHLEAVTPEVTCLSVSQTGDLVAVGVGSSVLFYDIAKTNDPGNGLLGAYTESHQTRISQLKFHPTMPHYLLSGSEDNLVNIFDVRQPTEDDALNGVINAESSVRHFGFFGPQNAFVWIQTNCNSLSLWNVGSTECLANYRWLSNTLAEKGFNVDHLVTCSYAEDYQCLILLCGTDIGGMSMFQVLPDDIVFMSTLTKSIHNSGIRCGAWAGQSLTFNGADIPRNALYTGSEDGSLVRWLPKDASCVAANGSRSTTKKPPGRRHPTVVNERRKLSVPGTKPY